MKTQDRVFVFTPVYNEAETIQELILRIAKAVRFLKNARLARLLAVDDGSTDSTPAILKKLESKYSFLKTMRKKHEGPLNAVLDGYAAGLKSPVDFIVRLDSDLEHEPERIPEMVALNQEGADLVVGLTRYSPRLGIADYTFNVLSGYHSGMKVSGRPFPQFCPGYVSFRKSALKKIFPKLLALALKFECKTGGQMTSVDLVIIALARKSGLRISFMDLDGTRLKSSRGFKKILRYFKLHLKTMRFLEEEKLVVVG